MNAANAVNLSSNFSLESHVIMRQLIRINDSLCAAKESLDLLQEIPHHCPTCTFDFPPDIYTLARVLLFAHRCYWFGGLRSSLLLSKNMKRSREWAGRSCPVCVKNNSRNGNRMKLDDMIVQLPHCGHVMHEMCAFAEFFKTSNDTRIVDMFTSVPRCPICSIPWTGEEDCIEKALESVPTLFSVVNSLMSFSDAPTHHSNEISDDLSDTT